MIKNPVLLCVVQWADLALSYKHFFLKRNISPFLLQSHNLNPNSITKLQNLILKSILLLLNIMAIYWKFSI